MILNVIVEKTSDGWGAYAPDLDAIIIALGDTHEAAIQDFRNALLDVFDLRREEGRNVPNITALEIRETREVETLETLAVAALQRNEQTTAHHNLVCLCASRRRRRFHLLQYFPVPSVHATGSRHSLCVPKRHL